MKLNEQRNHLDKIDEEISKLLNKRFQVVKKIKKIKKEEKLPIFDIKRETAVINNNLKYLDKEFQKEFIEIYQTILKTSKDFQEDE